MVDSVGNAGRWLVASESRWMNILSTWCGLSRPLLTRPVRSYGDCDAYGLVARYGRGLEISYRLEHARDARVAVLRVDGSTVVSLHAAGHASGMAVAADLPGGEYLVLVEGGDSRFVAPVRVAA